MNPEQTGLEMLVAELREQILFLREELGQVRAEAEAERRRMEAYQAAQEQQLAVKDAQIERLLGLLEGRRAIPAEEELPPPSAKVGEMPEGPEAAATPSEKPEPPAAESSRPVETLRQYLKSPSRVCRYLRSRQDRSMFYGYPSGNNVCWSPYAPKPRDRAYRALEGDHQMRFCLNEHHTECEFFKPPKEAEESPPSVDPQPA
jgi:hypothetical protein